MIRQTEGPACVDEIDETEWLARLDDVLREYRDKPGALIPVLQIAQAIFGYLPESALKRISLAWASPTAKWPAWSGSIRSSPPFRAAGT